MIEINMAIKNKLGQVVGYKHFQSKKASEIYAFYRQNSIPKSNKNKKKKNNNKQENKTSGDGQ